MQLIENVSEHKLIFIVNTLEGLKDYAGESIEPDEWDLQMITEAKKITMVRQSQLKNQQWKFKFLLDEYG